MNHTHASAAQGGTVAAGDIASGAALSKVDDTNVTLTLGGAIASALLKAVSITVVWVGLLAPTRGGTGNGFTKFSGPTTSEKTFTLPDINAILVTTTTLSNNTLPVSVTVLNVSGAVTFTSTATAARYVSVSSNAALPSFNVTGSGIYNNGTNVMGISCNSANVGNFRPSGPDFAGTVTFSTYTTGIATFSSAGIISSTSGATGSFTTTDGKTVTVTGGIITAIV